MQARFVSYIPFTFVLSRLATGPESTPVFVSSFSHSTVKPIVTKINMDLASEISLTAAVKVHCIFSDLSWTLTQRSTPFFDR
jgi:hypothetical protein